MPAIRHGEGALLLSLTGANCGPRQPRYRNRIGRQVSSTMDVGTEQGAPKAKAPVSSEAPEALDRDSF